MKVVAKEFKKFGDRRKMRKPREKQVKSKEENGTGGKQS